MNRINPLIVLKSLIFFAFAALISLSPSLKVIPNSLLASSYHDNQRLVELLLIGLVLLYRIAFKSSGLSSPINKTKNNKIISYAFYALITLAIISSCLAKSPRHALIEISLFAGLNYLSMLVIDLYHEDKALLVKRLIYVFWAGATWYMVSFYVGYITSTIFNTAKVWPALINGFSSIRSFNQYQLWGLGLMTLPLLIPNIKKISTRRLIHIGLVCWWVILFYSASRGILLAWGFGLLVAAVIYKKLAWPLIRLQLMHMGAGFLSYQLLFVVIPSLKGVALVTGSVLRSTTSDRVELWNLSLSLIHDHPVFGIGPMHFAWVNNTVAHPHNSVLQLMAEWGLPAALITLTLAAYGFVCWIKKFNSHSLQSESNLNRSLAIVLLFTLASNAAYSLVDGVIVMPISQVMMFTIIGLAMGHYGNKQLAETKTKSLALPLFASLVLIALVLSTLPEIIQNASGNENRFSIGYLAKGPRLWLELKDGQM